MLPILVAISGAAATTGSCHKRGSPGEGRGLPHGFANCNFRQAQYGVNENQRAGYGDVHDRTLHGLPGRQKNACRKSASLPK